MPECQAPLIRPLLNSLLYFPTRAIEQTPADFGLAYRDLTLETEDGESLHGWWIPARAPSLGHVLLSHGNAGNIGDRVLHARLLTSAGFDVLVFDYRGYGQSTGSPSEEGTYRDARAARRGLLAQEGVEESRILYLGESLGAAVVLPLALEAPPRGLVLQSAFTSVRDIARVHYPFLPRAAVPDAYPSLRRIRQLESPLLVLHGESDEIVPVDHGRALFEAAPEPKDIRVFSSAGHELVPLAGEAYGEAVASWAKGLGRV